MGKQAPLNAKYKSKTCNTFNERLYCPYGKRCLFRHDDRELEELNKYFYHFKIHFFSNTYLDSLKQSDMTETNFKL